MADSGDGPFELRSRTLGALPVVQHFLDCLQLDELLAHYVPSPSSRIQIPHATALGVLLRNVILGRAPLYGLQEWADGYQAGLLGLTDEQVKVLNDDRVGRAPEFRRSPIQRFTFGSVVRGVQDPPAGRVACG